MLPSTPLASTLTGICMFTDPPRSLYVILIVATIIAGGVYAKKQTRKSAIVFGVFAALLMALFLVGTFVENPRKEVIRRTQAMAKAATETNVDAFLEHVSPRFDVNGKKKDDLKRSMLWDTIREWNAQIEVTDFND